MKIFQPFLAQVGLTRGAGTKAEDGKADADAAEGDAADAEAPEAPEADASPKASPRRRVTAVLAKAKATRLAKAKAAVDAPLSKEELKEKAHRITQIHRANR